MIFPCLLVASWLSSTTLLSPNGPVTLRNVGRHLLPILKSTLLICCCLMSNSFRYAPAAWPAAPKETRYSCLHGGSHSFLSHAGHDNAVKIMHVHNTYIAVILALLCSPCCYLSPPYFQLRSGISLICMSSSLVLNIMQTISMFSRKWKLPTDGHYRQLMNQTYCHYILCTTAKHVMSSVTMLCTAVIWSTEESNMYTVSRVRTLLKNDDHDFAQSYRTYINVHTFDKQRTYIIFKHEVILYIFNWFQVSIKFGTRTKRT